jgi:hypothetical protein
MGRGYTTAVVARRSKTDVAILHPKLIFSP